MAGGVVSGEQLNERLEAYRDLVVRTATAYVDALANSNIREPRRVRLHQELLLAVRDYRVVELATAVLAVRDEERAKEQT